MKKAAHTTAPGFTLIEVMVYVVIFSILVAGLASFTQGTETSRVRNRNGREVGEQGARAMRTMTQAVRDSRALSTPGASATSTILRVETVDPASNPTTFSASAGILYVTEGARSPIALTSASVRVRDLLFTNLSAPATPGTVEIRFAIDTPGSEQDARRAPPVDFTGGASVR